MFCYNLPGEVYPLLTTWNALVMMGFGYTLGRGDCYRDTTVLFGIGLSFVLAICLLTCFEWKSDSGNELLCPSLLL